MNQKTIRVYGNNAQGIENDMIFYAVVKTIEGRKVVELKQMVPGSVRGEPL